MCVRTLEKRLRIALLALLFSVSAAAQTPTAHEEPTTKPMTWASEAAAEVIILPAPTPELAEPEFAHSAGNAVTQLLLKAHRNANQVAERVQHVEQSARGLAEIGRAHV